MLILDDDKPGIFGFDKKTYQFRARDKVAKLRVVRQDGADGVVTLQYKTEDPELAHHAIEGEDYEPAAGLLTFENHETEKVIEVPILPKDEEDLGDRDDVFAVRLYNPQPAVGAKLSKKAQCFVEIVGDNEVMRKAKGIEDMIETI